jgi:hypothetical protein
MGHLPTGVLIGLIPKSVRREQRLVSDEASPTFFTLVLSVNITSHS